MSAADGSASPEAGEGWDTDAKVAELLALNAKRPALEAAAGSSGASATALEDARLDPIFTDAFTVKRFLRARRGDVPAALTMLAKHQAHRRLDCPWWPSANVPLEHIRPDLDCGKAYLQGTDKAGRPVLWVRIGRHDKNEDRTQLSRFIWWAADEAVARADRAAGSSGGQFSVVIDSGDFGWGSFDTDAGIKIISNLAHNHPERLGRLIVVNTGWVFSAMWKVISVFIDPRTSKKISLWGGDFLPSLLAEVDEGTIPAWLGGKSTYEYAPADVEGYVTTKEAPFAHRPRLPGSVFWGPLAAPAGERDCGLI